ncbi:cupin [Synergistales bacterium]|nr:cupin [Synergistales bacterium]
MLYKFDSLEKAVTEKPRGGPGSMEGFFAFSMGKSPEGSPFQVVAHQILQPGSGLGYHQHTENEELYYIVSGHGTFTDNDKSEKQVGPGDFTLTLKGESHGLINTGSEPLAFVAVIAKKE